MNYTLMIAAAFILATIAVAALSPFENLPQAAPSQTAASDQSAPDESYDDDATAGGGGSGSNVRGHWEVGESPPQ